MHLHDNSSDLCIACCVGSMNLTHSTSPDGDAEPLPDDATLEIATKKVSADGGNGARDGWHLNGKPANGAWLAAQANGNEPTAGQEVDPPAAYPSAGAQPDWMFTNELTQLCHLVILCQDIPGMVRIPASVAPLEAPALKFQFPHCRWQG